MTPETHAQEAGETQPVALGTVPQAPARSCRCGCGRPVRRRKGAVYALDSCKRRAFIPKDKRPQQPGLDFNPPLGQRFYGEGYVPAFDQARWTAQQGRVLDCLKANRGRWYSFAELSGPTGVPEGTVRTRVSELIRAGEPIEVRTREACRFREVRMKGEA